MVNLTPLQNITPLQINTSIVDNTETIIPNLISNTNDLSNNYWGLMLLTGVFLYLFYTLYRDDGFFKYDSIKSLIGSSGITVMLGTVLLVSDITTSYTHLMWYGTLFAFSIVLAYILKRQGG